MPRKSPFRHHTALYPPPNHQKHALGSRDSPNYLSNRLLLLQIQSNFFYRKKEFWAE